jgi:hypothetical protein
MKGAWPVEAHGLGGRHYRPRFPGPDFDTYSVSNSPIPTEPGSFSTARNMAGCRDEFASYAHVSKGSRSFPPGAHAGMTRIYKGQNIPRVTSRKQLPLRRIRTWLGVSAARAEPYQLEWTTCWPPSGKFKPYNEAGEAPKLAVSSRDAWPRTPARSSPTINAELRPEFAPDVDKLTMDGLRRCCPGLRKVPRTQPGVLKDRVLIAGGCWACERTKEPAAAPTLAKRTGPGWSCNINGTSTS